MKFKKLGALLMAGAMALSMTACGGGEKGEYTLKEGKLMVGMEIGYPPMEYMAEDGVTPVGFDVDMAYEIGKRLGLEVELVDTAWDGIFASLDSDRYDCIMSSVSITPERQENYTLTEAYIANKLCIVTSKDLGVTSPADLAGKKVATQTETTADLYMRDLQENQGLVLDNYGVYDKVIYCFEELKNGRVDAVMVDSVVAAYYIGTDADKYSVVWESDEAEPMGICMKKGNEALLAKIEEAVDAIYADGTYAKIAEKHFGVGNTVAVR